MAFGLKCASETYQRVMNEILEPVKNCAKAFIDDVAVHSQSFEEHLMHLKSVFLHIRDSGIKLKISKCKFAQNRVKYLGHIVGGNTHSPDPGKIEAITQLLFPDTKKQMKSFIGLISYYRAYIPNLAETIKSLTDMTKKSHTIKLQPGAEELLAFETSKKQLISYPVLRCPDFTKPFIVESDASNVAIAGCLVQNFEDGLHPIAYTSCKLTPTQRNWSVIEREAFAIIHSLKKFDSFILGRPIYIITDHNPLIFITEVNPDNAKLVRWRLSLARYHVVSITHKKGSENSNVDALSRLFDVH